MRRRQKLPLPLSLSLPLPLLLRCGGGDSYALEAASSIFEAAFLWIIGIKCDDDDDDDDSTLFSLGSDDAAAAAGKHNLFLLTRPLTLSLCLSISISLSRLLYASVCEFATTPCLFALFVALRAKA